MNKFVHIYRAREKVLRVIKSLAHLDDSLIDVAKGIDENASAKFAECLIKLENAALQFQDSMEKLKGGINTLINEMQAKDDDIIDCEETDNGLKL
jgi:hypothetical protein